MKGVAIIQKKGGVGKTSLCHTLALGAAWNDKPSYLFHTDDREPMQINGRPYAYIDGRDLKRLSTVVDTLLNNDGLCIFDGGGNRPEFDKWISEFVDIVIIPVTADSESIDLGIETMQRLNDAGVDHAYYVINMISSHKNAKEYDVKEFFSRLDENKIMGAVKKVDAVKRLRISDKEPFQTPPTNVNNLSRAFYNIVSSKLEELAKA